MNLTDLINAQPVCIRYPCPGAPMDPTYVPPPGVVPVNQSPVLYAQGSVALPLVSMALGAFAGYLLGKRQGNAGAGAAAGAMVGYFWHPVG